MFDSDLEAFQVGFPAIGATALVTALFIIVTINIAMKMRKKKVVTGVETIVGHTGVAISDFEEEGMVKIGAEIWRATTDAPLTKGEKVCVTEVSGLDVQVIKKTQQEQK